MKNLIFAMSMAVLMPWSAGTAGPLDTLSSNGWYQAQTTNQCPTNGCDVHSSCDTSGFMYIFGGCVYGNNAGGTHSNEVLRFKVAGDSIGWVDRLYACNASNNPWHGSCQAGQTYDIKRNAVWISNFFGTLGPCQSGSSSTGQLYRFQCPNGPITKISDRALASNYLSYDPVNDMVIGVNSNGNGIVIYKCDSNTQRSVAYPFANYGRTFEVPRCFDTKRGLFVITQWSNLATKVNASGDTVLDTVKLMKSVWCLNPATGAWSKKTPPTFPWVFNAELAYDPVHDKYMYFGSTYSCQWKSTVPEVWAYDYDSNTWTRMPDNGRRFNSANPALSTWPGFRFKECWAFSPKSNAFVTWGHTTYGDCSDPLYSDEAAKLPLWIYRYDTSRTTALDAGTLAPAAGLEITASPNPSASFTIMAGTKSPAKCEITDISGRLIASLNLTATQGRQTAVWRGTDMQGKNIPAGIYLVRLHAGNNIFSKKLILAR